MPARRFACEVLAAALGLDAVRLGCLQIHRLRWRRVVHVKVCGRRRRCQQFFLTFLLSEFKVVLQYALDDSLLSLASLLIVREIQDIRLDHVVDDAVVAFELANPMQNCTLHVASLCFLHGLVQLLFLLFQVPAVIVRGQYLHLAFELSHLARDGWTPGALSGVKETFLKCR